ncbi:MAG: hypothetical protein EDM03_15990 [Porphyrobacter sp. IPPAS B-1204]|nr:MAG: hypothetical protein EDM03_15990 [Porphyrobacter sp. IPPAS B-1204]
MNKATASRPKVSPRFFALVLLPFAIPVLLTFALVAFVGEDWPRTMVPGSGLKLAGFVATALTSLLVWRLMTRGITDARVRMATVLLCGVVGLMGWPVWSVGIMPSVNGYSLGQPQTVPMVLERTESTPVSRSSQRNHWVWLRPKAPGSPAGPGRYFIPEDLYESWNRQPPGTVNVTIAEGMLGAVVVTGYAADPRTD